MSKHSIQTQPKSREREDCRGSLEITASWRSQCPLECIYCRTLSILPVVIVPHPCLLACVCVPTRSECFGNIITLKLSQPKLINPPSPHMCMSEVFHSLRQPSPGLHHYTRNISLSLSPNFVVACSFNSAAIAPPPSCYFDCTRNEVASHKSFIVTLYIYTLSTDCRNYITWNHQDPQDVYI